MNTKAFAPMVAIFIIVGMAILGIGGYIVIQKLHPVPVYTQTPTPTQLVGGDRDIHGCIGSAGYSWCEVKQKCLRTWEEPCVVVTSTTAIDIVKNLPEVKKWLSLFTGPGSTGPVTGGKPTIAIDGEKDGVYSVHVYEELSDHLATFNWYDVDIKTGEVKPMF